MKSQPASIGSRDALRFAKEGNEQKKNKIGIDLRLKLEVAREIFRVDLARAIFELEGSVEGVIDFFDEGNQRTNVALAQAGARIVLLKLFNQPARIINADLKAIVCRA